MELNKNLRVGIPAPYCRHIVVALFYGQTVRHITLSFFKSPKQNYFPLYPISFSAVVNIGSPGT